MKAGRYINHDSRLIIRNTVHGPIVSKKFIAVAYIEPELDEGIKEKCAICLNGIKDIELFPIIEKLCYEVFKLIEDGSENDDIKSMKGKKIFIELLNGQLNKNIEKGGNRNE